LISIAAYLPAATKLMKEKVLIICLTNRPFSTYYVIQEGAEILDEEGDASILDLGIIGAGTRVEHYEMAGYMTAISLAERIGAGEAVSLLKQSLAEEEAADVKLHHVGDSLLRTAQTGAGNSVSGGKMTSAHS